MNRSDIMAAARAQAERAHRAAPIVMQINDDGGSAKVSTQGYILLQSTLPNNIPELPSDLVPPRAHALKQQLDGGGPVIDS